MVLEERDLLAENFVWRLLTKHLHSASARRRTSPDISPLHGSGCLYRCLTKLCCGLQHAGSMRIFKAGRVVLPIHPCDRDHRTSYWHPATTSKIAFVKTIAKPKSCDLP